MVWELVSSRPRHLQVAAFQEVGSTVALPHHHHHRHPHPRPVAASHAAAAAAAAAAAVEEEWPCYVLAGHVMAAEVGKKQKAEGGSFAMEEFSPVGAVVVAVAVQFEEGSVPAPLARLSIVLAAVVAGDVLLQ